MLAVPNRQLLCETLVAPNEGARRPLPSPGVSFLVPATKCCLPFCLHRLLTRLVRDMQLRPQRAHRASSPADQGIQPRWQSAADDLSAALQRVKVGYLGQLRAPSSFGLQRAASATALPTPHRPSIHSITPSATSINTPAPSPSL
jgi:hypothetical protein